MSLTPPPEQAPRSSLAHMFGVLAQRPWVRARQFLGTVDASGAWTLGVESAASLIAEHAADPVLLVGTAFSFVHLCDGLEVAGIVPALPAGSCVMETGGYKGRSRVVTRQELHGLVTQRLGVPPSFIVSEYGMSELSSQAYDQVAGDGAPADEARSAAPARVFRFPPWVRAKVVSPETGQEVAVGERGLIRVWDLANIWSVMAVLTEDLGIRRADGIELAGRFGQAEPRGCSLLSAES